MKKALSDSKLANQLEELRLSYPQAYLHIKGNTDSVIRRLAIQSLETAFAEMQENIHIDYDVLMAHPDAEEALSWYLQRGQVNAHRILVLVKPNRNYAGCFFVNSSDKIVARRFLLEPYKVENLMQTFDGHLLLWKKAWTPDDTTCENDGEDNAINFADMF